MRAPDQRRAFDPFNSQVPGWVWAFIFLAPSAADAFIGEPLGLPSGLFTTALAVALFLGNAIAGLLGVGGGKGWLLVSPLPSVITAAGFAAFYALAKIAPGPFALAALLLLLFAPPILLALLAWRAWRQTQTSRTRTG
jgi:hypothetical protein